MSTSKNTRLKQAMPGEHNSDAIIKQSKHISPSSLSHSKKPPTSNLDGIPEPQRRHNADLLEHMMMPSKASLKPLPSSSLSKNLFARLNQLSEPVTRTLKFWNKKSFEVNQYDPCFKVIYLGNLGIQFWSKDESCLEKPLNTLWNNYLVNMKTEIIMRLTICNSGLKAITRQHGLTQYWSNRLVYCCSHKDYPKIFAWIYRHEGKKMRQELRCHAVFCSSPERASKMVSLLSQRLARALQEFKREKKSRGGPLPLAQSPSIGTKDKSLSSSPSTLALMQRSLPRTVPLRRQILAKGSANYRPPLERSKSAPKLTSIREEDYESEEEVDVEDDDQDLYENDDISRDEYEYEQSFGDRDDEDEDDDDEDEDDDSSDLNRRTKRNNDAEDIDDNAHKIETKSLTLTVNEEISNSSSVYATGDISYDNIVINKHHLLTNHERLDSESTQTAPELTTINVSAASSLQRRGSLMKRGQSRFVHDPSESSGEITESMSSEHQHSVNSYQHDLDSQIAAERTTATMNATYSISCHISSNSSSSSSASDDSDGNSMRHQSHSRASHDLHNESKKSSANINMRSKCKSSSLNKQSSIRPTAEIPASTCLGHEISMKSKGSDNAKTSFTDSVVDTSRSIIVDESKGATLTTATSQQEPSVDESTQDIISSWSNNLLIK